MPKIAKEKISQEAKEIKRRITTEILRLATGGFGLVAALAWNELIKETVNQYIKPIIGGASGVISLLVYAILVTFLAVVVTYNLSRLAEKNKN